MAEETIRQVLLTTAGFSTKQVIVALRKRNVDPVPLLQRACLSEQKSHENRRRFLELAAETLGDSAFGLHLVEQASPREAGLSFYVASAGKNVSEALTLFARYCQIVNEIMRVKLTPKPEGAVVDVSFIGVSGHQARQQTEVGVAAVVKGLREVTGRHISPTQVSFVHWRNSNLREFERFFGCPVEFGASANQFVLSNEILALRLITEDRHLLEMLQPICDEAAKKRNTATGTLRAAVESEAQKLLPHGKARRNSVAKTLGMSVRTLTRKLAAEGTTYEQVVDQLRKSLALEYMKEQGASLSQLAWLLGYEGSTSFTHAFKRWTGRSPSEIRNEKRLPAPA